MSPKTLDKLTNFNIFLLSILLQNSATATPYVSLFPQENLGHLPIQHHQRHLPAPALVVGLPHPLQPPARGACGGRSGGHRPRFWARRSKHRKRHLDGSPPRRPMENLMWRFRNHAPKFRCGFFRSPFCFFWFGYNFPPFFVLVKCRTPFLELVQPEFLQKSRVFQTFRTGFCFSQQPSLSITTISRVTFHLSSTSQAVRRLRSCSFPQKAGGTASRLSGKNVRLGRAEFL